MPSAPPRVCARCGKQARGRCPCRPAWEGSTNKGTGDRRYAAVRRVYMSHHLRCEWPGCTEPSRECDHIIPIAEGGAKYDWGNLQALCPPHHKKKTTADALRGKTRLR